MPKTGRHIGNKERLENVKRCEELLDEIFRMFVISINNAASSCDLCGIVRQTDDHRLKHNVRRCEVECRRGDLWSLTSTGGDGSWPTGAAASPGWANVDGEDPE